MKSLDVVPIEEVDEAMLLEVKRRFDATYPHFLGDKTFEADGQ